MKKVYRGFVNMCFLFLSKRFAHLYSRNCYQSIDTLPIWYWNKVQESGNLSYLIRSKNVHIEKKQPSRIKLIALKVLWRKLLDEFIERFGFSDNFLEIHRKQKEIARLIVQRCAGDKSVNVFIKIAEEELSSLQKSEKGGDFWTNKAAIEKGMGFMINPMVCMTGEFYSYTALLEKQSKQASK